MGTRAWRRIAATVGAATLMSAGLVAVSATPSYALSCDETFYPGWNGGYGVWCGGANATYYQAAVECRASPDDRLTRRVLGPVRVVGGRDASFASCVWVDQHYAVRGYVRYW